MAARTQDKAELTPAVELENFINVSPPITPLNIPKEARNQTTAAVLAGTGPRPKWELWTGQ